MSNPKSRQLTLRKSVIFPFGLLYSTITLRARDFVDYRAIVERAAAARVKIESDYCLGINILDVQITIYILLIQTLCKCKKAAAILLTITHF